jgi:hypothetical protein
MGADRDTTSVLLNLHRGELVGAPVSLICILGVYNKFYCG